jgi:hypothetical protein
MVFEFKAPQRIMKVCVLQPDYSASKVDYGNYDPPRNLDHLIPGSRIDYVFINKLTTFKQLQSLSGKGYDIFVNLCEGYLDWDIPSIDVVYFLESLKLPHTGPASILYDPSKELMKYVAYRANIKTPSFAVIKEKDDIEIKVAGMDYPLFIKPAHAGDSLGIDKDSLETNPSDLKKKAEQLLTEYNSLMIEEYIAGREFSVLVASNADGKTSTAYKPVEYIFPEGYKYKSYDLKTSVLSTNANIPCESKFEDQLMECSKSIFKGFNGHGYARLDFRIDANDDIYFLEINFACSVFYSGIYKGTADYILDFDGIGQSGFLKHIIEEGIARFQRNQIMYKRQGNSISGYGIYSTKSIAMGEIIFRGEEMLHRIVDKKWIQENWSKEEQDIFARYALPINNGVYIIWDQNPENWAPQSHSCNPNTEYVGLNVHAKTNISKEEELTLDYSFIYDETMKPFECLCGSPNCKGIIHGMKKYPI